MNVNVNLMTESVIKIKTGITIYVNVSVKFQRNIVCVETIIFGILRYGVVKMVVTCNDITNIAKAVPTNFNERKVTCKTKVFYILFAFLSITTALLIAVRIY